jgi:transcriptional regulator with XRE-family HTH domain
MRIKLGEKIRKLRRHDRKTQEMLADALGVTGQAVSRWEAGGGYPDMEIIPAIANYFNVSIDELFGYNGEREQKKQKIIADADAMINAQDDLGDCVAMLREAASEFPAEAQILLRLGFALNMYGWQKYGARGYTEDGCDYALNDADYNAKNEYWQEALTIFDKVLEMGLGPDDRLAVITVMVRQYAAIGAYDRAEAIAAKQDPVIISRECLLAAASEGEKRDLYQGEALIELTRQIKIIAENAVLSKLSLVRSETGVRILSGIARLYELIFDDGNCGIGHSDLRDLYLWCAVLTARQDNLACATEYFDIAFGHAEKYDAIRQTGVYQYTAPLVSKVTFPSDNWPKNPEGSWKGWLSVAPENLVEAIRGNDRYARCFADM